MSKKLASSIRGGIILFILIGGLAACATTGEFSTKQGQINPTISSTVPTPEPKETLVPSEEFGLFVEMNDRYNGQVGVQPIAQPIYRKRHIFNQRVYVFDRDEPITVTATVLVLDAGELGITNCNLAEYRAQVVDAQGQDVPLTSEGRATLYSASDHHCVSNLGADRTTPFIQTFRIDEWFDLSAGGGFTLFLTRRVGVGNETQVLE